MNLNAGGAQFVQHITININQLTVTPSSGDGNGAPPMVIKKILAEWGMTVGNTHVAADSGLGQAGSDARVVNTGDTPEQLEAEQSSVDRNRPAGLCAGACAGDAVSADLSEADARSPRHPSPAITDTFRNDIHIRVETWTAEVQVHIDNRDVDELRRVSVELNEWVLAHNEALRAEDRARCWLVLARIEVFLTEDGEEAEVK